MNSDELNKKLNALELELIAAHREREIAKPSYDWQDNLMLEIQKVSNKTSQ